MKKVLVTIPFSEDKKKELQDTNQNLEFQFIDAGYSLG